MIFRRQEEEPPPQARVGARTEAVHRAVSPGAAGEAAAGGPREGVIVALFSLLAVAAVGAMLWLEESDAVDDPVQKAARGEVRGLADESLIRPQNIRRALAEIDSRSHRLITNLRVAPDRINAVVRDPDGERKVLTIDPGFDVEESDFGTGLDEAIEVSEVNAGAPARIVAAVTKKAGVSEDDVDYLVLLPGLSRLDSAWGVFLKTGPADRRHWVASATGGDVRVPGELSARQKAANQRQRRAFERRQRRQQRQAARRQSCLRRAGDADDVARCLS